MTKQRLPKSLSQSELEAFRSVISNVRDRLAISLMAYAGLRVSEVANLKLQNITHEQILRFIGKGSKESEIPVSKRLRDELERAFKERPSQATHDYVLWDLRDPSKPITRFAIYKMVRAYGTKAGIKRRIHPHMLRHTFGTLFYRSTGDIGRVQKAMRHTKPTTTAIYTHLTTEDQRQDFEKIDQRPWIIKMWSQLKPAMPEFFNPKPKPFFIGETIGRAKEITDLRKAYKNKVNTVIIGEEGVGKKHLLKGLYDGYKDSGECVYSLDEFSPTRTSLIAICEMLVKDHLLSDVPKSRGTKPFIEVIKQIAKDNPIILIIYSLSDITKNEVRALRQLSNFCTIFATINTSQRSKLTDIFFGNFQEIPLETFDKKTTYDFASKASADLHIDRTAYLRHIHIESLGNPKAILELIQSTRQTGDTQPHHAGIQKVLPATPILSFIVITVMMSRYTSSAVERPDWKIYAMIILLGILPFIVIDKLLQMRRK